MLVAVEVSRLVLESPKCEHHDEFEEGTVNQGRSHSKNASGQNPWNGRARILGRTNLHNGWGPGLGLVQGSWSEFSFCQLFVQKLLICCCSPARLERGHLALDPRTILKASCQGLEMQTDGPTDRIHKLCFEKERSARIRTLSLGPDVHCLCLAILSVATGISYVQKSGLLHTWSPRPCSG